MGPSDADIEKQAGRPVEADQPVRSPRGAKLNCQGWPQEAALRMLMNSLDPRVAECPLELLACGTTGKVLCDWEAYYATVKALKALQANETLLLQSGKPAGVVKTSRNAPRVVIEKYNTGVRLPSSATLAPNVTALLFQTSAASWTCLGTQQALPIAFQVLNALSQTHFAGGLAGRLVVSGGMGSTGGALPLATGLLGGVFLGIDVDGESIRRRIRAGYCDYCVNTLDETLRILKNAVRQKQAVAVGLVGNCAEVIPELAARGVLPDVLTDQTGAHDLLNGYLPSGLTVKEATNLRRRNPQGYLSRARDSINRHFNGMLALQRLGSVVFEFGNGIQAAARECGRVQEERPFPDYVEAYLRPLLDKRLAPVRWVALSGEAADIRRLDHLMLELLPDDDLLARWIPLAQKYVRFQGLPARVCWLGEEARFQLADHVNSLVAERAIKAPMVIAWDYAQGNVKAAWDSKLGAKATDENPHPEPATNALLDAAAGASWLSLESGNNYIQTSVAAVADGSPAAAESLPSVLRNDFAAGILRVASAGHTTA